MNHDQFSLPFLDTTSLGGGFGLYDGSSTQKRAGKSAPNHEGAGLFETPVSEPTASIPAQDRTPVIAAQDYRLVGDRRLAEGWKTRAEDNLAAIRLAAAIESEGRHARSDEQEKLARFTAFGASDLADRIFRRASEGFAPAWEDLGLELEQLVSREDLASLSRATQYAHYTPEFMIRAIWRTLRKMGFDGGRVLEPGCGTGLFFALSPEALDGKLALTGVEMDPTTARIARLLYPNARIRHEDFTKAKLPELFDLAIGNPPFSDRTVLADDPSGELRLSLHDYFIARSVERLRPGGLAAFVTSRWTMDKVDRKARDHIASMADLVGAVRLPEGAMHDRAGTEVVVDILFLQKREAGTAPAGAAWNGLAEAVPAEDGEAMLSINRYFVEHPEMVLGTHARTSSAYGPTYTLKPVLSTPGALWDLLGHTLDRLPRDLFKAAATEAKTGFQTTVRVGTAAEGATIKEGSYLVHEGALVQIIDGKPEPVPVREGKGAEGILAKHARIIRGLIAVRDAVREVLRTQANDEPWGSAQIRLRSAYALFVRNFGPINLTTISETVTADGDTRETFRRPNLQPFLDDPDVWLVASIEDYDLESGTAKRGPIFRERVLHPDTTPAIETAEDALAVALHETGLVDLDRIAELLGRSRETTIAELGERIFLDPQPTIALNRDTWVTADAYLSGKVRDKLTAAHAAAALDARYQRNVGALEKTLPEDLKPSDITARLGAPWIPADVVSSFAEEVLGVKTPIYHTVEIASWSFSVNAFAGLASSSTDWGTARRHAGELLMDALNASLPQIYDGFEEDGVKKRVLNAADTEAAKDKLAKIKAAFETWVWKEVERADRLARIYNDRFNNLVPRHFDGSHLTIPGASSVISFYAHQKRVIWRIVASGTTYVAHAVGAGKTFSLAAAIMEQKRLGLVTKAIVLALLEDELCRSLVNQATGSTLVPTPTATTVNSGAGAVVTYPYSLASGNGTGSATCGSVSVADSTAGAATLGGVSIDMANQQLSILNGILNTIRPQVDSIAQSYWQNKTQASLQPLLGVYQSATQSYTQQLTSAAQAITAQLRANLSATDARDGNLGLSKNEVQLSTLGWSSAAAYYLGFARLNGLTLSLASGIPTVNMPTFEGLSPSLQADIAPLFTSSSSFLDKLKTYVSTADGMTSPGGNADTLTGTAGTSAGTDGGGMMERLFRALNFTPTLLQSFVDNLSPTAQNWADPFGGLIALGNQMVMVAMTALGLAGIASTTTGTTATTLFNALTMNWAGVVGTLTLSVLMQFFATPIFMGCMALLIPGLTIAFVLPMIPWVMWIAGIIGYLILVCEAMVAVPLWMMAHLTYEGDGLHGRGFAGYELLFNILFRPVLMIIGLFLGYFIFTCASWLIRMSFGIAAAFVLGDGWIVTNWLGMFVLLSIFVLAHIVAAIASFRMITLIPHHVPRMLGFSSQNRVDMDEFAQGVGLIGTQKALMTIGKNVQSKQLTSQSENSGGQGGQKAIGVSGRKDTSPSGVDTTTQAQMDMGGGQRETGDD